jgi:hypothetical protein
MDLVGLTLSFDREDHIVFPPAGFNGQPLAILVETLCYGVFVLG